MGVKFDGILLGVVFRGKPTGKPIYRVPPMLTHTRMNNCLAKTHTVKKSGFDRSCAIINHIAYRVH